jgi:hypothetical protein
LTESIIRPSIIPADGNAAEETGLRAEPEASSNVRRVSEVLALPEGLGVANESSADGKFFHEGPGPVPRKRQARVGVVEGVLDGSSPRGFQVQRDISRREFVAS